MFFGYGNKAGFASYSLMFLPFYFLMYMVISFFLIDSIPYFIDYEAYDKIVAGGWAWKKYITEPVSASFLMLLGYFSLGAFELYISTWFFAFLISLVVLYKKGVSFFSLYLYLILNPVSLILLQFSRQYIAYLFFLIAILFYENKIRSLFVLALSFLSHTASAAFSGMAFYLIGSRFFHFLIVVLVSFFAFYLLSVFYFSEHTVHEVDKGRGRVAIVVLNFIFFILLSVKRKKIVLSFSLLCLFFLYSFIITPQAGRFAPYFIVFLALYGFSSFRALSNIFVINLFFICNIIFSFYMVWSGQYGFGP